MIRILPIIFFLPIVLMAADFEALMNEGNVHYQAGRYLEARDDYMRILSSGYESADLHYNLASSYFKLNDVGLSILHYRIAAKLAPRDQEISYNLEHARLYRRDRFDLPEPMPLVKWFSKLREGLTLKEIRLWLLLTWWLLVVTVLVYLFQRQKPGGAVFLYGPILSGIIFIALGGWFLDRSTHSDKLEAVVLASELQAHSAPLESSDVLFVIHEGTEGRVGQNTEDWVELQLPDGKRGWVLEAALGIF